MKDSPTYKEQVRNSHRNSASEAAIQMVNLGKIESSDYENVATRIFNWLQESDETKPR